MSSFVVWMMFANLEHVIVVVMQVSPTNTPGVEQKHIDNFTRK